MWKQQKLKHLVSLVYQSGNATQQTSIAFYSSRRKFSPTQDRKLVDKVQVAVKGGPGGTGSAAYKKLRQTRFPLPDGGDGGRGGDVILECSPGIWDLSNVRKHLHAERGANGQSKNLIGSRGVDKVAQVPVGTLVHLVSGTLASKIHFSTDKEKYPWEITSDSDDSCDEISKDCQKKENSSEEASKSSSSCDGSEDESNMDNKTSNQSQVSLSKISKDITDIQVVEHSSQPDRGVEDSDEIRSNTAEQCSGMSVNEVKLDNFIENSENNVILQESIKYSVAEFSEPGQRLLVASGGGGGRGSISLAKIRNEMRFKARDKQGNNNERRNVDPQIDDCNSEPGTPGSEAILILELKLIADIGLVGLPNAGKSTLLGTISKAKPRVGNYAFTTLRPSIGKLQYEDFFSITVADIPGLIKGAHENRGLGHEFLRHIERTKALAYVIDLSSNLTDKMVVRPWEQVRDLVFELEEHQPGMSNRSSLIVANKIDENGAEEALKELKIRMPDAPIYPICAVLGEGILELKVGLRKLFDEKQAWTPDLTKMMEIDAA